MSVIILCLCVYYMVNFFQWQEIYLVLRRVDLAWLLGAGSLTVIIYWVLRTIRWYIMLEAVGSHVDFSRLYLVNSILLSFSTITPFQSGEALKIEFLKKAGQLDRVPGYSVFIIERLLDLFIVVALAMVSILFNVSEIIDVKPLFILVGLASCGFLLGIVLLRRIPGSHPLSRIIQPFNQFMGNGTVLVCAAFLTLAGWLVIALGWHVCLLSISIKLTFPQSVAVVSIITLVNLVSFIPGAIGVSEVGIATFLVYLNQSAPVAQAGAFSIRIYGILTLFLGLVHYIWFLTVRTGEKKAL